jgi:hypothetical protein
MRVILRWLILVIALSVLWGIIFNVAETPAHKFHAKLVRNIQHRIIYLCMHMYKGSNGGTDLCFE